MGGGFAVRSFETFKDVQFKEYNSELGLIGVSVNAFLSYYLRD
jgi:hypothetical protein